MTALYQRQLTGEGQMIDVSMLESMLSLTLSEIQAAQFPVAPPGRPIFGPIATKDGYIMPAIASERTFQNLAIASGHPEWITDPRFAKYTDRRKHWGDLVDELEVVVDDADHRRSTSDFRPARRPVLALSHGQGSDGRSAARAPPGLCRDR